MVVGNGRLLNPLVERSDNQIVNEKQCRELLNYMKPVFMMVVEMELT